QQDPWQEFADGHEVNQLVYGRVTKLVPFGAFVQVGEGIEGLVHISEMAAHHVEAPEQVVTPGEELWVKIIDIDLERRRISLSIKQAAEGGTVSAEYQQYYGEHAYDEQGNYIGPDYHEGDAPPEGPPAPTAATPEALASLSTDALAGLSADVPAAAPEASADAASEVAAEPEAIAEPAPEPTTPEAPEAETEVTGESE
ncbi:MAG: small subunit ribosomal protein, partial [Actinomycetota bacterium]|nr:small subunit ribosomal protein [Actinomycetota bacterium]